MNPSTYHDLLKPMYIPTQSYQTARQKIKSGDILLCSGSYLISKMIQKETNSKWSHVGLVRYDEVIDRAMVYESVEDRGVQIVPLSQYLDDYDHEGKPYDGQLLIARHTELQSENTGIMFSKASDYLGAQYGIKELFEIAYRLIFPYSNDIDTDNFVSSEYVHMCFKAAGIEIEHRGSYITPNDFFSDPCVRPLFYIHI
jgi:hypothetical protein